MRRSSAHRRQRGACRAAAATAAFAMAVPAHAQYAVSDSGDTAWMLISAIVILIAAIPGFALYVAGRLRSGSIASAFTHMFGIVAGVSTVWALIGYSLAFGVGDPWLGGAGNAVLGNLGELREGLTVPESAFALVQMAAAVLAAVLIAGAVAERVRLGWLMLLAPIWSLVAYAPIARSLWNGGWLARMGVQDYAGGLLLCVGAGTAALVAATIVGRRAEPALPPTPGGEALSLAGVALMWVGWLALGGGLALGATDSTAATLINIHLAAAGGVIAGGLAQHVLSGRASAVGLAQGALAGLAASSAGAILIGPGGAIVIGLVAGALCPVIGNILRSVLKVDDAAQIGGTFLGGGVIGALLLVPFASTSLGGAGLNEGISVGGALLAQLIGIGAVVAWSGIVTAILGLAISMVIPVRVTSAVEAQGLDVG